MRALFCGFATMLLVVTAGLADTFEDAQKAFKGKKYKQTIQLLDTHLKEKNDDAKAYLLRGQAHAITKSPAKAMDDFNKTIELAPKNGVAYFQRGKLYAQDNKTEKAMADFDKAVELSPKLGPVYVERGNLHLSCNTPDGADKALKDFERALKVNDKLPGAYLGRGRVAAEKNAIVATFMRDGKVFAAITGFRPESAKQALPDLDKAIELGLKSSQVFLLRARCHEALGDPAKEVADRKEVAALDKENGQNLNQLAWILATSHEPKVRDGKAALEIAKALVERTKNMEPYVLDTLAAAQAESGDFKAAAETQQKVIDAIKPPANSPFHARLELYKQNKPYRLPAPPK